MEGAVRAQAIRSPWIGALGMGVLDERESLELAFPVHEHVALTRLSLAGGTEIGFRNLRLGIHHRIAD